MFLPPWQLKCLQILLYEAALQKYAITPGKSLQLLTTHVVSGSAQNHAHSLDLATITKKNTQDLSHAF